ncbi:TIGR03086 family metal-binding protein [Nocardioides jensenii]|uniref:TIGR03086 family metal-binding protein n=1 Tax=Nocardioides jensenii TaxID=1843 RepID=UPI00082B41A4|nr:TIGR03086 family metal-binding protein [Nocardioides jensenii]
MMTAAESVPILSRAIDQAGDVLAAVREDQLADPTPCAEWNVERLMGHLGVAPANFLAAARGEQVEWGAEPVRPDQGWAEEFRERGDDLIHHWHQAGEGGDGLSPQMAVTELAVHTWDLATAIGWERPLDEGVAQCGLDFMSASLTDELRGEAFGPQVQVGADAPAVDRLAGFAGRRP